MNSTNLTARRLTFLGLFLLAFAVVLFATYLSREEAVSPAKEYDLSEKEFEEVRELAIAGDCIAAYKLAKFHSNVTLKSAEAIRWLRIAVKCPDTNPKIELVSMLSGDESPAAISEIENLIAQIEKMDPVAAEYARKALKNSREPQNTTQP